MATKNPCYTRAEKITPTGIMWHDTAAGNPYLKRYVGPDDGRLGKNQYGNYWNDPKHAVCVHAFIGKLADGSLATYQILPWNYRGAHCGRAANLTHISFEICDDGYKDPDYFAKCYKEAVEFTAYLCKLYNIKPVKPHLIDHHEGNVLGIASNHSDCGPWMRKFGKSMDTVRADVAALLAKEAVPAKPVEKQQAPQKTTGKDWSDMRKTYKAPAGAATVVYADNKKQQKVGEVFAGSTCQVIAEQGALAVVLYKVAATGAYKVGFADGKGVQG
jgi:hypothetical protein